MENNKEKEKKDIDQCINMSVAGGGEKSVDGNLLYKL